jgi:hypothetical protein
MAGLLEGQNRAIGLFAINLAIPFKKTLQYLAITSDMTWQGLRH